MKQLYSINSGQADKEDKEGAPRLPSDKDHSRARCPGGGNRGHLLPGLFEHETPGSEEESTNQ